MTATPRLSAAALPSALSALLAAGPVAGPAPAFAQGRGEVAFRLQILHFSDADGSGPGALENVEPFSALVAHFRGRAPDATLLLSSGDNMLSSFRHRAAGRESMAGVLGVPAPGRGDVALLNALGVDASSLGNHELDLGVAPFLRAIAPERDPGTEAVWAGARFPHLAANVSLRPDPSAPPPAPGGCGAGDCAGSVAASAVVRVGGERVALVGAVTPEITKITSARALAAAPRGFDPESAESLAALASILQREVDVHERRGIDKVILVSHMQDLSIERELARRLSGVDVVVGGGSGTILADADDQLRPGDRARAPYPLVERSPGGEPVLLVNAGGDYRYLGRLVVSFDAEGGIVPELLDPAENGPRSSAPDALPAAARGLVMPEVRAVARALRNAVRDLEAEEGGRVLAATLARLEGDEALIRTQETNLGNLVADSMLEAARARDGSVRAALFNAGAVRASFPPGPITRADALAALPFTSGVVLVEATAAELATVLEHALGETGPGEWPGRFPLAAGLRLAFDPGRPPADWRNADLCGDPRNPAFGTVSRLRELAVGPDADGEWETVVEDGALAGDPDRAFLVATVDFLATGGDSYPWPCAGSLAGRPAPVPFADQRDVFMNHLGRHYADSPFDRPETPPALDARVRNLALD